MNQLFKLKENGTNLRTEIIAGLTTFFAMAYIIAVNPGILSQSGLPWGAAFLATIIAAAIGTLVMGLFANVPYAQAPGMGLNAFFVFTVCFTLGFTWQQALSMVFICGIINILITVTRVRRHIIKAIPKELQHAISGGIGVFIAYIGLVDGGILTNSSTDGFVPALVTFDKPEIWIFLGCLALITILLVLKVKGAILIGIITASIVAVLSGTVSFNDGSTTSLGEALKQLPQTFGVVFTKAGIPSLVTGGAKSIIVSLVSIFAFSLSDTFDTIGTFIGTGRRSGIFSEKEERLMDTSSGIKTKLERALFADAIATSVGAVFGTSNTTTYVESAAGIAVGGRTGLTSVVTAVCLIISAFFAKYVSAIPFAATGPALVIVGVLMISSFIDVKWTDIEDAVPALFAGVFMAFSYSITNGIAFAFIFYCIIKLFKKQAKTVHPILWVSSGLFVLNYILQAVV